MIRRGSPQEAIAHVWLRFHPQAINRLFPSQTVFPEGQTNLVSQIRRIAGAKFTSSWHAGSRATIPGPKDVTVDVDTKDGPRRFFSVEVGAQTANYVGVFENRPVKQLSPLTAAAAAAAFDQLWEAFDRDHAMFVLRPEVDWDKVREAYRPKALASKSADEFAAVCADMLRQLRDLHVWLSVAGASVRCSIVPDQPMPTPPLSIAFWATFTRPVQRSVGHHDQRDRFPCDLRLERSEVPAQCDQVLERMRNTRGMIVDVRLNGGGGEPMAEKVAGRFLEKEFVYAYSQFRNGPSHTNLTEKFQRKIAPRGPWCYNRPVVLLIGQKCMSSNESFIGMMTGDPEVTTMGDHTCGSSGNPRIVDLPLDMTVSVPCWIDYLPDGTPLDERGFQPQVIFTPTPGAFAGGRDDLLVAALARLSQAPLPVKPIEGPAAKPRRPVYRITVVPSKGELAKRHCRHATSRAPGAEGCARRIGARGLGGLPKAASKKIEVAWQLRQPTPMDTAIDRAPPAPGSCQMRLALGGHGKGDCGFSRHLDLENRPL